MRALILAPRLNGEGVGEVRKTFELVATLSSLVDLTVASLETRKGPPLAKQLPNCEVVTFSEPQFTKKNNQFLAILKPEVVFFNRAVSRWLQGTAGSFDIAHQVLPAGPRYPTVLRKFNIPYVIGSVGGGLSTPAPFKREMNTESWFTRLRLMDQLRFKYDPWLRASYRNAEVVLGVAPYMKEILADLDISRFEVFMRQGVKSVLPAQKRRVSPGQLKLLHVGRAVRTKGLRDCIRALAYLSDLPDITLTSVGDGEEIEFCRIEAKKLGVTNRVTFAGRLPRDEVDKFYEHSDVLVFPSFRESMGGVIFEAMNWSLPIITVARGGPDSILNSECGLKVPVTSPQQMPVDIANAIRILVDNPEQRIQMGLAGRRYVEREALWSAKAESLVHLYRDVLGQKAI